MFVVAGMKTITASFSLILLLVQEYIAASVEQFPVICDQLDNLVTTHPQGAHIQLVADRTQARPAYVVLGATAFVVFLSLSIIIAVIGLKIFVLLVATILALVWLVHPNTRGASVLNEKCVKPAIEFALKKMGKKAGDTPVKIASVEVLSVADEKKEN